MSRDIAFCYGKGQCLQIYHCAPEVFFLFNPTFILVRHTNDYHSVRKEEVNKIDWGQWNQEDVHEDMACIK